MFSLQKLFGHLVKVTKEETPNREKPFEWYEEIKGTRGLLYPQSLDNDLVCVQTTPRIGKKLLLLFGNKAVFKRRGDFEFELIIPLELVKTTFRYIKPKKRRQLTEAQKEVLKARLKVS